jgi:hypothetical protein
MAGIAKYSDNSFIDGAIDIAAQYGIACVSMSAIAVKAGAPSPRCWAGAATNRCTPGSGCNATLARILAGR